MKRKANSTSTFIVKKRKTTKPVYKKTKPSLTARVKKIIKGVSEPKHYYINTEITVPASKSYYTLPLLAMIAQNDTNTGREGDIINIDAIKLSMSFTNAEFLTTAGCSVWYQVLIIKHKKEFGTGTNTFSAANAGIMQADIRSNNNSYLGIDGNIDPRLCTVIMDKKVKLTPALGSSSFNNLDVEFRNWTVKIDKKYQYATGTNYGLPKDRNYYLVVIPYNPNNATDCGHVTLCADVIFKDL